MLITKEMSISDAVQKYPQVASVFMDFGMGCLGCAASRYENIEQGALVHNIDADALIEALNKAISE